MMWLLFMMSIICTLTLLLMTHLLLLYYYFTCKLLLTSSFLFCDNIILTALSMVFEDYSHIIYRNYFGRLVYFFIFQMFVLIS